VDGEESRRPQPHRPSYNNKKRTFDVLRKADIFICYRQLAPWGIRTRSQSSSMATISMPK